MTRFGDAKRQKYYKFIAQYSEVEIFEAEERYDEWANADGGIIDSGPELEVDENE